MQELVFLQECFRVRNALQIQIVKIETWCENVQEFEDENMFLAYYSLGSLYENTCFFSEFMLQIHQANVF